MQSDVSYLAWSKVGGVHGWGCMLISSIIDITRLGVKELKHYTWFQKQIKKRS